MKILVAYRCGEIEQFEAPAEILVSAAGIVSICERSGEITYRDWETLRSICGLASADGSDIGASAYRHDAGASALATDVRKAAGAA